MSDLCIHELSQNFQKMREMKHCLLFEEEKKNCYISWKLDDCWRNILWNMPYVTHNHFISPQLNKNCHFQIEENFIYTWYIIKSVFGWRTACVLFALVLFSLIKHPFHKYMDLCLTKIRNRHEQDAPLTLSWLMLNSLLHFGP